MTVAEAARPVSSDAAIDLDRLLTPRSVAIVGAQPEPTSIGGGVLANLEAFGYSGRIHLVSRSKDEIRGRPCVKAIGDLPKGIDVAVLIVPQGAILDSARACAERGIGAVIVFASGFAEAGDEGRLQQDELARLCTDHGIALLGPNCMGYTNYSAGIPLTIEPVDVRPLAAAGRRVAVVAQSGATAANIRFAMHARGIETSLVIATGNEATLGAEHFIDVMIRDPQNTAIGVYVEQIRNPGLFLAAARRAREKGIPIVLLHPGSSARGRAAAQSHTGALAGDHAVMETILRNEAIALVDTTDELFDVLTHLLDGFKEVKLSSARNRDLYLTVLAQAILSVTLGFLFGLTITFLLSLAIPLLGSSLALEVSRISLLKVGSVSLVIAAISAMLPIRQIAGLDPAMVFRGK